MAKRNRLRFTMWIDEFKNLTADMCILYIMDLFDGENVQFINQNEKRVRGVQQVNYIPSYYDYDLS